jgi:hypothetical protein
MAKDTGVVAFPIAPGRYDATAAKFLGRIDGGTWSTDACWLWVGARNLKGYGIFAPSKRVQFRAHRYALSLHLGREPGALVLHKCDNPPCVNPMHLMEGTHGENMRQMADRRRAAREERHHKAKLSFDEVLAIIILHRSGDYTTAELALMFGVSKATAICVASGTRWRDAHALADAMLEARKK